MEVCKIVSFQSSYDTSNMNFQPGCSTAEVGRYWDGAGLGHSSNRLTRCQNFDDAPRTCTCTSNSVVCGLDRCDRGHLLPGYGLISDRLPTDARPGNP